MYAILVVSLLCVFVGLLVWGKIERHWISLAVVLILLLCKAVTIDEALAYANWDVLCLILGMSFLTLYLERCGFVALIAKYVVKRFGHSLHALFFSISLIAGLVSMFMENVSVVILFFPVLYTATKLLGVDPVIPTIMLTLSANIAGSATMIGDPPAIITAGAFNLTFMDFIVYGGRPSMFFFTLISMVTAIAITTAVSLRGGALSRRMQGNEKNCSPPTPDTSRVFLAEATTFLVVKILLLSLRDMLHIPLSLTAAIAVGGVTIARIAHRDFNTVAYVFRHGFEWKTIVFLIGVFILSGSFEKHGVALTLAKGLLYLSGGNPLVLTSVLLWISVGFSAVIDNVPYTMTMIPVVKKVSDFATIDPVIAMWSTLIGVTLGGNLTYIGASANVVAIRSLEKYGYEISFTDFIKVSIVYNTASILTAWALYTALYFAT